MGGLEGSAASPRPDVSILIVSWNTRELTRACLDSLRVEIEDELVAETIVVDNGSVDGSAELLRERDDVVFVANAANAGYAAAVNQAYGLARGEFVLLLNSDVVFERGALSVLVRFLREHPGIAGVGPLYVNPDGSAQQHHYRFPTFAMTLAASSAALRRLPPLARSLARYTMQDEEFSEPIRVPQPSASCLLLRRAALPSTHLLDERFPIYFNDVELARRLAAEGSELWVTPEASVVHVHGASTKLLGGSLKRQHLASLVRYLEQTEPRGRLIVFRVVVFVQKLLLRLLRRPGAMTTRDLVAALRGDPGPLPQAPRP